MEVTLTIDTESDASNSQSGFYNEASGVEVNQGNNKLTFGPWSDEGFYVNFTVKEWDLKLGDLFRVWFEFSGGVNLQSYQEGSKNYVLCIVVDEEFILSLSLDPLVISNQQYSNDQWALNNIEIQASQTGTLCGLTLPRNVPPPATGEIVFTWNNNEDGTIPTFDYNSTAQNNALVWQELEDNNMRFLRYL